MNRPLLSAIIPIYNEEEILVSSVATTLHTLKSFTDNFEVIIVNDGSTDNSTALLNKNFQDTDRVSICHQPLNGGLGSAIRKGIEISQGTYIICVPADSPLTKEVFQKFFNHLQDGDVLVSYRRERLGYTWWMHLNSVTFHALVSLLFGMRLRDYNWIHLYHRKIFDEGQIIINYKGIFMLAEVLIKAKRKGYSFFEFEVEQTQRLTGIASASKPANILRTLRDIWHFRLFG